MQAGLGQANVSAAELARFDALAARWWDTSGPMRPLHAMNRLRTRWIGARLGDASGRALLDVGCGAGIAAETLAREGFRVLGIDAAAQTIAAARAHAAGSGLAVEYRVAAAEELLADAAQFDAITALEVIEHVPDPAAFLRTLSGLLAPGGRLFVSTLSRTARSFAVAIVGAEYIAGLLPRGTHDWRRFVTPGELAGHLRGAGLRLADIAGMQPDLLRGGWRTTRDVGVNYIAMATR